MQAWQAVALQRSQHSHLMLSTSQLGPARFIPPHVLPHSIELTSVSLCTPTRWLHHCMCTLDQPLSDQGVVRGSIHRCVHC